MSVTQVAVDADPQTTDTPPAVLQSEAEALATDRALGVSERVGRATDTADPGSRTEATDAPVDGGWTQWPGDGRSPEGAYQNEMLAAPIDPDS